MFIAFICMKFFGNIGQIIDWCPAGAGNSHLRNPELCHSLGQFGANFGRNKLDRSSRKMLFPC